ncbi:MAG: acetylxylan esterase [Gemmataceae bacterium]|nr:acetylxylan esterase [Gemmataceae bacterium]MCI0741342.1 acetylxylan esterase [Gemmataceae bacterium]
MRALTCLTALVICFPLLAQTLPQHNPRQTLNRYLLGEAKKHFDERRKIVANLKTPSEIQDRQKQLRAKFIQALGGFPEKTPLNAQVTGMLKADGFRVEKVIYESRPHHHVTANFYIPDGKGPFPGVLVPCGHSANGKAAEAYQRVCILMAKNGLAVLCYDPIGQGERIQLLDKTGKPAIPGSTSEHTMVGVGALLVGQSTATYRIWDGIRSLDYLESRPEIDPKKLGCTGNSGGGTLTAYLMALDDRIWAAAPSCYITSLERLFETIGPQDAEQNITGQVAFGMEHADYLTMRAPKPTLMAVATQDFFDIQGAWTTFREASLIYGKLGYGERVALFEFDDKHGFSKPRREAATRWLCRWLLGKDEAIFEGNFPNIKDADLQCTRSGQVLEDFKGKSAFHFNLEQAQALAGERGKFLATPDLEKQRAEIRRLIRLPKTLPDNAEEWKNFSTNLNNKENRLYSFPFSTENGIELHMTALRPQQLTANPILVLHDDDGLRQSSKKAQKAQLAESHILQFSVRGFGQTAASIPGKKPAFFGSDFKEAFLAIHLDRPLLGQRVFDILSVVDLVCRSTNSKEVDVHATGALGPIALHAAVLDSRIAKLTLENSLVSWMNVVQSPISYNQLTNVVPGALKVYDLPDLAALVAPRPLTIRNALDTEGNPIAQKELEKAHGSARARYRQAQAQKNLKLEGKDGF